MIKDEDVLSQVRLNWTGVEALRIKLKISASSAVGRSRGGMFPFALANAAHNLPFIHAYAVMNDVLLQLSDEGHFVRKSKFLGELLKQSKDVLTWNNFALVSEGYSRRNAVAHRGELLERGDCWRYVDAVKAELLGWCVIVDS